ncbi:MAG: hypothetical protein MN733_27775 [Nitrososphaera sp.]|nr:hypothetical protein [Nitrososphaera sp.]
MSNIEIVNEFISKLQKHAEYKSRLYDGYNANMTINHALALSIEESGEVASAVIRERYEVAKAECLDLAHCAILIYITLHRKLDNE